MDTIQNTNPITHEQNQFTQELITSQSPQKHQQSALSKKNQEKQNVNKYNNFFEQFPDNLENLISDKNNMHQTSIQQVHSLQFKYNPLEKKSQSQNSHYQSLNSSITNKKPSIQYNHPHDQPQNSETGIVSILLESTFEHSENFKRLSDFINKQKQQQHQNQNNINNLNSFDCIDDNSDSIEKNLIPVTNFNNNFNLLYQQKHNHSCQTQNSIIQQTQGQKADGLIISQSLNQLPSHKNNINSKSIQNFVSLLTDENNFNNSIDKDNKESENKIQQSIKQEITRIITKKLNNLNQESSNKNTFQQEKYQIQPRQYVNSAEENQIENEKSDKNQIENSQKQKNIDTIQILQVLDEKAAMDQNYESPFLRQSNKVENLIFKDSNNQENCIKLKPKKLDQNKNQRLKTTNQREKQKKMAVSQSQNFISSKTNSCNVSRQQSLEKIDFMNTQKDHNTRIKSEFEYYNNNKQQDVFKNRSVSRSKSKEKQIVLSKSSQNFLKQQKPDAKILSDITQNNKHKANQNIRQKNKIIHHHDTFHESLKTNISQNDYNNQLLQYFKNQKDKNKTIPTNSSQNNNNMKKYFKNKENIKAASNEIQSKFPSQQNNNLSQQNFVPLIENKYRRIYEELQILSQKQINVASQK